MPDHGSNHRLPRPLEAGDLHTMAVAAGLIQQAEPFTLAHWTFATLVAEYCATVAEADGQAGCAAAVDIRANFGLS